MTSFRLSVVALAILVVSAVVGVAAWAAGDVDQGITYGYAIDDAGRQVLVVEEVRPGGLADHDGVEPGFIELSVNVSLGGDGIDAQLYTPPGDADAQSHAVAASPWLLVYMEKPGELPSPMPPEYLGSQVFVPDSAYARLQSGVLALIAGGLLCLAGLLWVGYRRTARKPDSGVELPLLAASATPLFLLPAYVTLAPALVVVTSVLVALASLVAGVAFAQLIDAPRARRRALVASSVLAAAAALVGIVAVMLGTERGVVSVLRWGLASAAVLLPALMLADQLRHDAGRLAGSSRLATVLR